MSIFVYKWHGYLSKMFALDRMTLLDGTVCMYIYIYVCVCVYIYICIYIYINIHMCVHMYI